MLRIVRFSSVAALASLLAACQAVNYAPSPSLPQMQQPRDQIEGNWVDPNGIVSSFQSGRFETRTSDTNSLLADGDYSYVNDRLVQIELRSQLRQTTSTVNCALVTPSQLNCTSSDQSQFSLTRRA